MWWQKRKNQTYYRHVEGVLNNLSGESIVDVGGRDTPMVLCGSFQQRTVINLAPVPLEDRQDGVEYIIGDFLDWEVKPFDVVVCLQVLEHLPDHKVISFTQRLFDTARDKVVISIPYQWPSGFIKGHRQDPVDEHKLFGWTGKEPYESILVEGKGKRKLKRLICVYGDVA